MSFEQYLGLHKKTLKEKIQIPTNDFILDYIESENQNLIGAWYYKYS